MLRRTLFRLLTTQVSAAAVEATCGIVVEIVQSCSSCNIVSCLQGALSQLSYGCFKLVTSTSYWDLGR